MVEGKSGMQMMAESFFKAIIPEDQINKMVSAFEGMKQLVESVDSRLKIIQCELTNVSDRIGRLEHAAKLPIGGTALERSELNGQSQLEV